MKYSLNGTIVSLESSPVSLESILDTSGVDKALAEANKAIESFAIASNVKGMESFGYKSTEGLSEKLKSAAKIVLNGIKIFFKKLWEFIVTGAKWVAGLFKKKNKNTDKIIVDAIKSAKDPKEIASKVVEGIVDEMESKGVSIVPKAQDIAKYGEAPEQLTFSNPKADDVGEYVVPTEKQEAYDKMYALLNAKLCPGGNVGYSDEFSEMVYYLTFVNLVTMEFELPDYVKSYCNRRDVTEMLSVISISGINNQKTNLKPGDEFYNCAEALLNKWIDVVDEASENFKKCKEPAEKAAYDRYSSDKKDALSSFCRNGFDSYIKYIQMKIKNVENVSDFLKDLTDEKDFNDTASLLFTKLYKFQMEVGTTFKQALTATLKIASFVSKTNEILNRIENAGKDSVKRLA